MSILLLIASLSAYAICYHGFWSSLVMPVISLFLYLFTMKKIKNRLIATAFTLSTAGIGLIFNGMASSGIINKSYDSGLIITAIIAICYISDRFAKYFQKNELDGGAL